MLAADQGRLIEPFHRTKNVELAEGFGLGLAITRKAVEVHGGSIKVLSEPGSGSAFSVLLPHGSAFDGAGLLRGDRP